MERFVRAATDWEGLIWIVFIFIWMIVQVFARLGKKRRENAPPPAASPQAPQPLQPEAMDHELQRFLKSLGVTTEVKAPPPPPPLPAPAQTRVRVRRPPSRQPAPPVPRHDGEMVIPGPRAAGKAVGKALTPREMASSFSRSAKASQMILKIPGMKMPTMTFGPARAGAQQPSGLRPDWKSKRDLKRAMINHIILSPPPALQPRPYLSGHGAT